jgi:hypothetical protein
MRNEARIERRQHERLTLPNPLRTSIAGNPAHVIDASLGGVGIIHHDGALPRGAEVRIHFLSDDGPITMECEVARTGPNQNLRYHGEEVAWRTGLRIVSIDAESAARLRKLATSRDRDTP